MLHFRNLSNPSDQAGVVRAKVDDSWFGSDGLRWSGQNVSYPYYWVIIRSDKTLDGDEHPQAIFTAVQTTVLESVAAASSSAAAVSSSLASQSSASLRSLSSVSATSTAGTDGRVQHALSDSSFPRWAIAVIVVLGFLAISAIGLLAFLITRRLRRRRHEENSRHSIGSSSPMILNNDGEMRERHDSPLPPPAGVGALSMHDGASTDSGGLSGADAAIIAHAFRTTLRKPDFTGSTVEEGDSPDRDELDGDDNLMGGIGSSAFGKELAEEGRDIRSVSSSRGVRIESHPPEPGTSTEESR